MRAQITGKSGETAEVSTNGSVNVQSNARGAVVVTPNDSTDLTTIPTKGIYVGITGDLKVTLNDGSTVTFASLSSGVIHPLAVKRVFATGTTATSILAVY